MPLATRLLRSVPCALILLTSHTLHAQDADKVVVTDLVKHWQTLKRLSLDVAQAIPDKEYALQAIPLESEAAKIGPPMNGIALPHVLACSIALGVSAPARFQSAFDRPMDATKAGVMINLTVAYDFCIDALNRTSDTELFKISARGYKGHTATKFDIVWDAYARAAFTLGRIEMSLRSKGIAPPDVGPKFDF